MKNLQRTEIKLARASMEACEVIEKSRKIADKLFDTAEFKAAKTIMTYVSVRNEPDTLYIIKKAFNAGKCVAVPYVDNDMSMSAYYLDSIKYLCKGEFGIPSVCPEIAELCNKTDIDLVLVPGIAFDESGARIGYGKGFYDRFLADMNTVKTALCYDFQVVDKIFADGHDIFMDFILTESRVIHCDKG